LTRKRPLWSGLLLGASSRARVATRALAQGEDRTKVLGVGAAGDRTLVADKAAEDILLKSILGVRGTRVLSEEAGMVGEPEAPTLAVVDPLDGSSNFKRGIPFYCTSVAIADGQRLEDVTYGIVRNLVTGEAYEGWKGGGATKDGRRIKTSRTASASEAVVDVDVSGGDLSLVSRLARLIAASERQVHFGANALELCLLAEGKLDSFVDLRGKMRVTDFAAGCLIAREAGASISCPDGSPFNPRLSLHGRFSLVASANGALHSEVLGLASGE
jgi:myo-inositol-1(or 4)-monophosphatase